MGQPPPGPTWFPSDENCYDQLDREAGRREDERSAETDESDMSTQSGQSNSESESNEEMGRPIQNFKTRKKITADITEEKFKNHEDSGYKSSNSSNCMTSRHVDSDERPQKAFRERAKIWNPPFSQLWRP